MMAFPEYTMVLNVTLVCCRQDKKNFRMAHTYIVNISFLREALPNSTKGGFMMTHRKCRDVSYD